MDIKGDRHGLMVIKGDGLVWIPGTPDSTGKLPSKRQISLVTSQEPTVPLTSENYNVREDVFGTQSHDLKCDQLSTILQMI